jgi:hypothetical protein
MNCVISSVIPYSFHPTGDGGWLSQKSGPGIRGPVKRAPGSVECKPGVINRLRYRSRAEIHQNCP